MGTDIMSGMAARVRSLTTLFHRQSQSEMLPERLEEANAPREVEEDGASHAVVEASHEPDGGVGRPRRASTRV